MAEMPVDMHFVCRLCLANPKDDLKSIFDEALGPNRLAYKIQQLVAIQVIFLRGNHWNLCRNFIVDIGPYCSNDFIITFSKGFDLLLYMPAEATPR